MNTITKTFFINADPDGTIRYFKTQDNRSPSIDVITVVAGTSMLTSAAQVSQLTLNAIPGFGDEVTFFDDSGVLHVRSVIAKADATHFQVSGSNVTVTGKPFTFRPVRGGTAATDGWHDVSNALSKTIQYHVTTLGSTTVVFTIEGKQGGPGAVPTLLYSVSIAATGTGAFKVIPEDVVSIRVGVSVTGGPATDSASAWVTYTVTP